LEGEKIILTKPAFSGSSSSSSGVYVFEYVLHISRSLAPENHQVFSGAVAVGFREGIYLGSPKARDQTACPGYLKTCHELFGRNWTSRVKLTQKLEATLLHCYQVDHVFWFLLLIDRQKISSKDFKYNSSNVSS